MLTIILPGYSPTNREWAFETKKNLQLDHEILVYEWEHWKTGKEMEFDHEVSNILSIVNLTPVNFIAKSVGTSVLMHVSSKISDLINKIILCGIPINPAEHLKGISKINKNNVLVIQNSHDPFMPYKLIEKYIHIMYKDVSVVEKDSTTHDYPYYEDFQKFLS